MRFLFALAFLLIISFSNTKAQSVYLDSLRNALSFSGSYVSSEDAEGSGFAAAFTYKGILSIGIARLTGNTINSENGDEKFSGNGWAGFLTLTISSELKNQNLGVELAVTKEIFNYEENTSSNRIDGDKIETDIFGIGLNFSRRLTDPGSKAAFIFQFSSTVFPIVESRFIETNSRPFTSTNGFIVLTVAPVLILGQHPNIRVAIEPSVSYTSDENTSFYSYGIGSTIIF